MKTSVTIIRDTDFSFIKTTKKEDGSEFSRKLERGQPEYGNACHDFHMAKVSLVVGNQITK